MRLSVRSGSKYAMRLFGNYPQGQIMKTYLVFKTIAFDGRTFLASGAMAYFQEDDNANSQSVRDIIESRIVRWLFSQDVFRSLIVGELTNNNSHVVYGLSVTNPVIQNTNKKPGDVDILICSPEHPEQAIAIETKRVKVLLANDGSQIVNKLNDLDEGIIQANGLQSLGFWKSYLMPIIVVDARKRRSANTILKYQIQKETRPIYEVPLHSTMHRDVGVGFVEIIQPTGRDYSEQGSVGICVDKNACELRQPAQLTERISNWLKQRHR